MCSSEFIIRLLEAILVWPFAAVLIALLLQRPLTELIDNLDLRWKQKDGGELRLRRSRQPSVQEAKTIAGEPAQPGGITVKPPEGLEDGLTDHGRTLLQQIGTSFMLEEQVKTLEPDLELAGKTQKAREYLMLRALARTQIIAAFERIAGVIYQSQVDALIFLNNQPIQPGSNVFVSVPNEELTRFFEAGRKASGNVLQFEPWLQFLRNSSLVIPNPVAPGDGSKVAITIRGQEFLAYLASEGRTSGLPF